MSSEPLLDRYVEGTLTPRRMIGVRDHLRNCASCRALLEELKVVDGLLATARPAGLPANFTFAVMAEANGLSPAAPREHPLWSFLALYLAAAWVAAVLGIALSGTNPGALFALVSSGLARTASGAGALSSTFAHGLDGMTPALAAFGAGVLIIDAAVAGAAAAFYLVVRPRLAARLAAFSEAI